MNVSSIFKRIDFNSQIEIKHSKGFEGEFYRDFRGVLMWDF